MLASLFSVEMWERFSFYGMQGILLYYMYFSAVQGGLEIEQGLAASLVGAYGGGVYLSTILGAWLADRLLGSERVLFGAAILIMAGHIALALLPGWLQASHGFHWGFGAAAAGMALGLVIYTAGRSRLPAEAHRVPNPLPVAERRKYGLVFAGIGLIIGALLITGTVTADNLVMSMADAAIGASVLYFVLIFSSRKVDAPERGRVAAFIPLYVASAAFWALFQQQFTFIAV